MGLGTQAPRDLDPGADGGGLDRVDADQSVDDLSVELAVPVGVRTEPRGQSANHPTDHATHGVAILTRSSDRLDERLFAIRAGRDQGRVEVDLGESVPGRRTLGHHVRPELEHRRTLGDPVPREQLGADRARHDPRPGLPRRGTLEHIAHVVELVRRRAAGVVGVPGARPGHGAALGLLSIDRPGVHDLGPVFPIAVFQLEHERTAHGPAVPQTAGDDDLVPLDALATATAETVLPTFEPRVDECLIELQTRRQPFENRRQPWPVGLPTGEKTKPPHTRPSRKSRSNETMNQLYAVPPKPPRSRSFDLCYDRLAPWLNDFGFPQF